MFGAIGKTFLFLHKTFPLVGTLSLLALLQLSANAALAAPPSSDEEKAKIVGNPISLVIHPAKIDLVGPRSMQQLVVSGKYADGKIRDLTPFAVFSPSKKDFFSITPDGFILPKANGHSTVTITVGGQKAEIPVVVSSFDQPKPVSFRHDMIPALSVGGCNSGACHGTPSGKNGFKLSLRGYDPASDYVELTHDIFGRRTSKLGPEASLIYLKGLGQVSHEGGQRFQENSIPAKIIHAWLSEGLQDDDSKLPALKSVEVIPGSRVLHQPSRWQQLAVIAHFADGKSKDVTRLTVFSSSDSGIAEVSNTGFVEFNETGEVAILCRYIDEMITVRLTYLEPKGGFVWNNPSANNFVDTHVFNKLKMLNILPSDLCSDSEFIRRAYLDLCGIPPGAEEVKAFLKSNDPTKRAKLIDTLLEQKDYADFWTLKWSDVFRSTRKSIQVKGTHVFRKWMFDHVQKNSPFDQVVTELLTSSGSTFSNPAANYYRIAKDPTSLAETTAQLFFGIRMQCCKCHNHPFEKWTQDDYYSLAAFFAQVKQRKDYFEPDKKTPGAEVIFLARTGDVTHPRKGGVVAPKYLGGLTPKLDSEADRRVLLAKWLTSPDNPFFAKSVANRIWFHLLGRGIVDPVDDFRDSNPSANDELLDALAQDFAKHKFDIKHLIRTIMNSRTYQLSAKTNNFNKQDNKYFSHAVTKLYTAEQLFDSICQVTEIPEQFSGEPLGTRAAQLPDGEFNHPFLKTFGQPARELACECERESESNLAQALQLINGPFVNDRLRNPNNRLGKLLAKKLPDQQILDELYLVCLSRLPVTGEVNVALGHVQRAVDKRKAWEDVFWALINSKEFLFRH